MILNKVRKRLWLRLVPILLALALANPSFAQEVVFELDPAETSIGFTLGDILHTVHGTFKLKSGVIRFDPATGVASGLVVVDATSGESGGGLRDRRMHKEILESQRYQEITFAPVRIQGHVGTQGESQVEIAGVIKLHGSEHEVTMTAQVQPTGDQRSARMHFVIPYVKWGLKNPSTFLLRVSTNVDIDIRATGRLTGLSGHPDLPSGR